jgi:UDP-arabinose 4-epimerase
MSSENILVTGGAGYIGSHACKVLAAAGYLSRHARQSRQGPRVGSPVGPFIRGDVGDEPLVRRILRENHISGVMHFAGYAAVGESMQEPGRYFQNNLGATIALLNAMRAEGVSNIVFSSTCATYGIPESLPITEDHPQRPMNPYGDSKLFCERALAWFHAAHGIRYAALRYFNAAGADADGELGQDTEIATHLIPLTIDAALGRRAHLSIYGTDYHTPDGTAIRDYVHVTDLALAHISALERLAAGRDCMHLNLGTGQRVSVREVIRMVEEVGGRPVPVMDTPRRAGDPPELVASSAKAAAELGWRPQHSDLRNIVATAWAWHLRKGAREGRAVAAE